MIEVRPAVASDATRIADIYNDAVLHTTAVWNEHTVDAANRADWIAQRQCDGFPVLVAIEPGESADDDSGVGCAVVGFASYGSWRPWDGYRHTVEHCVYVDRDARRRGVAKLLLTELIRQAIASDLHVMVAGIESSNEASIRLHQQLGFETCGTLREVGTKFGRWLDLTFMQKTLQQAR